MTIEYTQDLIIGHLGKHNAPKNTNLLHNL
jgi:hypothetical protein